MRQNQQYSRRLGTTAPLRLDIPDVVSTCFRVTIWICQLAGPIKRFARFDAGPFLAELKVHFPCQRHRKAPSSRDVCWRLARRPFISKIDPNRSTATHLPEPSMLVVD